MGGRFGRTTGPARDDCDKPDCVGSKDGVECVDAPDAVPASERFGSSPTVHLSEPQSQD